jgi:predicted GH43/DUF377 family glycosyl hydrolase
MWIQKLLVLSLVFISLLSYNACSKSTDGPKGDVTGLAADFSKYSPSCFVADSGNPIISMGSFFTGSNWNDPHVLKIGNQFVMYASADVNFGQNIKIYRLVSTDAKNWSLSPSTAVFERSSNPAAWDSSCTETPAVVYFKGQYYMFYTGYTDQSDIATYKIGFATSPDGISWTRQNPQFSPTAPTNTTPNLDFNQWVVGEPAPVVFNDQIYLYFAANGAHLSVMSSMFTIGLVTSSDGVTWSSQQMVLTPDQTLYPRGTYLGHSTPHAQVINGKVNLFFDVALDPFKQVKIHRAVSTDGVTGWTHDSTSIMDRPSWADDQINGPSVLVDGNKMYMWWGGQGNISAFPNINMGIGLSVCPL